MLIITDNGAYEVTGNQSVPGAGRACLAEMARAAGVEKVQIVETESELEAAIPKIFGEEGPLVFVLRMEKSSEPPPKPADPMRDRAWRLKRALER